MTEHTGAAATAAVRDDGQWQKRQQRYWDGISRDYDDLYCTRWSRRENDWVSRRLRFAGVGPEPLVLDLGCGTGLGRTLVGHHNPGAHYVGLDISPDMAGPLAERGVRVRIGPMEDLSDFATGSVDVVISLFSSLSYACSTEAVFAETARVLAPGGYAYFSVLSAHALSRLRSGMVRGFYQTRGDHRPDDTVPVREHTSKSMRRLGEQAGLRPLWITGMNLFSGLVESPLLWGAGALGAKALPDLAHTIEALYLKAE